MSQRARNVLLVIAAIYIVSAVTAVVLLFAVSDRATTAERKADTNAAIINAQNHDRAVRLRQVCLAQYRQQRDDRRRRISDFKRLPAFLKAGITFGASPEVVTKLAKRELRRNLRIIDSNRKLPKFCAQRRWRIFLPRSIFPKAQAWRAGRTRK